MPGPRAPGYTPGLRRARDLLAEARSVALHRYERLTRAFEAIYLCCVEIATVQQQAIAATGHPLRTLVDGAMLVLDMPYDDTIAITHLLRWCRFEVDVSVEPCTPETAHRLGESVLARTLAWLADRAAKGAEPTAADAQSTVAARTPAARSRQTRRRGNGE